MSTKDKLQEIFRLVFDDDEIEIDENTTADDIEEWDSLTHIQLIVEIENAFSIKFSMVETMKLKNVGELISLIEKKMS